MSKTVTPYDSYEGFVRTVIRAYWESGKSSRVTFLALLLATRETWAVALDKTLTPGAGKKALAGAAGAAAVAVLLRAFLGGPLGLLLTGRVPGVPRRRLRQEPRARVDPRGAGPGAGRRVPAALAGDRRRTTARATSRTSSASSWSTASSRACSPRSRPAWTSPGGADELPDDKAHEEAKRSGGFASHVAKQKEAKEAEESDG